jgi:hypothetical protein
MFVRTWPDDDFMPRFNIPLGVPVFQSHWETDFRTSANSASDDAFPERRAKPGLIGQSAGYIPYHSVSMFVWIQKNDWVASFNSPIDRTYNNILFECYLRA